MAFVLTIVFLLLLLLYCANDKANKTNRISAYYKDHPPCKYQEEYLLACEYYHKYLFDGESAQDAYGHALKSARIDIYNSGYLPSNLELCGTSGYDPNSEGITKKKLLYSNAYLEPHDPPNGITIHRSNNQFDIVGIFFFRHEDHDGYGTIGDREFATHNPNNKSDQKWKEYCDQLDAKFDSLVIQSLVDYGIVDGEIHEGYVYDVQYTWYGGSKYSLKSHCVETQTEKFKTKWMNPDLFSKPWWQVLGFSEDEQFSEMAKRALDENTILSALRIAKHNGPEYEKILELHKDELPNYLAKKRERQPTKQKEEPTTPYGR